MSILSLINIYQLVFSKIMFYETWHSSQDDGNAVWPARRAMLAALAVSDMILLDLAKNRLTCPDPWLPVALPAEGMSCPTIDEQRDTHNQLPDQGDQVSDAAEGT